jgi:NADPH:quinone reductase-like Zn-dependent oxidoreductase
MKAFALGSSDRPATIIDIPKPEIGAADALIAVKAASVNGFDAFQATGAMTGMMEHVFPTVIGRDFAGIVEAVGPGFGSFAVGDEVFGFVPAPPPLKVGTFAEYLAAGQSVVLARKPAGLSFVQAAGIPLAGAAALDLLEAIDAHGGDIVLVVGATGGVGNLVVQIAASRHLKVIATALPDQAEFMRGLGATETVDYSEGSIVDAVRALYPDGVNALIDLINRKDSLPELTTLVRDGGHVASLMNAVDMEQLAARKVAGINVAASPTDEKLQLLAEMAGAGTLRITIQATYPVDRADDALKAFQSGTLGKVVLTI